MQQKDAGYGSEGEQKGCRIKPGRGFRSEQGCRRGQRCSRVVISSGYPGCAGCREHNHSPQSGNAAACHDTEKEHDHQRKEGGKDHSQPGSAQEAEYSHTQDGNVQTGDRQDVNDTGHLIQELFFLG